MASRERTTRTSSPRTQRSTKPKARPAKRAASRGAAPRARKAADPVARRAQQVFVAFVMDQLADLRGLSARAMFGGHGLYRGEDFFGIVHRARLYFRVSDRTRALYEDCGMEPFRPGKGAAMKTYYEVPPEVIEDQREVIAWAREAARRG